MLQINFQDTNGKQGTISYKSADDFIANQQLEVPDLEDYYKVLSVTLDNQPIQLNDATVYGLYNYLENAKK